MMEKINICMVIEYLKFKDLTNAFFPLRHIVFHYGRLVCNVCESTEFSNLKLSFLSVKLLKWALLHLLHLK